MVEYTYGKDFAIRTETDFENCTGKITAVRLKTNADRLRAMTDEELAEIIINLGDCDNCYLYHRTCNMNTSCKDAVLEWLRKECDE